MLRAESGEIHPDAQTPPQIRSKTHRVNRNFSFTTEITVRCLTTRPLPGFFTIVLAFEKSRAMKTAIVGLI